MFASLNNFDFIFPMKIMYHHHLYANVGESTPREYLVIIYAVDIQCCICFWPCSPTPY